VSGNLDWSILVKPPFGGQLTDAILLTIEIAAYAWVAAMLIGMLVGIAREAPSGVVRWVAAAHVEIFRNIPVLVQLFFVYYVLPRLLPLHLRRELFRLGWEEISAVITLALYSSAKIAEHVRAGVNAVGRHIQRSAMATGLTWFQTQRFVIAPLLLRIIAPNLTSEFVTIFKGSSLAMMVGVTETAYVTQQLGTETFHWVEANAAGTAVYLLCAWVIAGVMSLVERRTRIPGLLRREGT
jgi:glutamate/aspartate transport system permease protein